MAKGLDKNREAERSCRPRAAGELIGEVGGQSFRRFGFIQSSIVSRWNEIVGDKYARVSAPESIRFPSGRKSGGALTLTVEGAHAPLIQHLAPAIIERVNRFFGYAAINRLIFRQGKIAEKSEPVTRASLRPVPKELGEGLREIADPELRACLESLAARIASTNVPPTIDDAEPALPTNKRRD